jgi:hypothetical protein
MAALVLAALFVVGAIRLSDLGARIGWPQDNWLIVLLKLNTGFSGVTPDALDVLDALDLVIMVLFGVLFLALYAVPYRVHQVWPAIAVALPFGGIVLFLLTHAAGRSALLVGVLMFSAVMSRGHVFGKASAYVGMMAGALLFFAGDIGTTLFAPSNAIAILIGAGYLLWIAWLALVGWRLLALGSGAFR